MPSTKNAIFVEINQLFLPYLEVFLKSLFRIYPDCPDLLIYHTDLNDTQLSRLRQHAAVKTVRLEEADFVSGPPMASHRPKQADPRISYARFLIWTDRMKEYENVIHLDTDLLILGRFDDLFSCERFTIFAETYQEEDSLFYNSRDPDLSRLLDEDGIRLPARVANCGVFVVPRKDRSPEDFETLCYLLKRYGKYIKWSDQSIINLWMAKKGIRATEDNRFNFQHRLIDTPGGVNELREARIFHFNGVDLTYRLFLVRCARRLCRMPYGWNIYLLVYGAVDNLLRFWRSRRKFFRSLIGTTRHFSPGLQNQ